MTRVRALCVMGLCVMVTALSACSSGYIRSDDLYPDDQNFRIDSEANIPDTTETREVLNVLYLYRQALVNKDVGALNRLVSDEYYENAGTTHTTSDDWTRSDLGEVLEMVIQSAEEIQYRVLVKDVQIQGRQARIDYEFQYAFRFRVDDREELDAGRDVNRLELVQEGDRWRITGGM
jgi:hypothetical protein